MVFNFVISPPTTYVVGTFASYEFCDSNLTIEVKKLKEKIYQVYGQYSTHFHFSTERNTAANIDSRNVCIGVKPEDLGRVIEWKCIDVVEVLLHRLE